MRAPKWVNRWGVATVMDGAVVGMAGRHVSKRRASRRVEELREAAAAVTGREVHYQVVRRNRHSLSDWGVRPDLAAWSSGPAAARDAAVQPVALTTS